MRLLCCICLARLMRRDCREDTSIRRSDVDRNEVMAIPEEGGWKCKVNESWALFQGQFCSL